MVWMGWLFSQEWWRKELWRANAPAGTTFEQQMNGLAKRFNADANDYILQARTWEKHNVGTTPGFDGDVEKALGTLECIDCASKRHFLCSWSGVLVSRTLQRVPVRTLLGGQP